MSAAILRHPAYVEWPADPRDRLPLTLWDARSIAEAVGGTASHGGEAAWPGGAREGPEGGYVRLCESCYRAKSCTGTLGHAA